MTPPASHSRESRWLATAIAAAVGMLLLTNWAGYQHFVLDGPPPLAYYAFIILVVIAQQILRTSDLRPILGEPLLVWFLVFAVSGLLWLAASGDFEEEAVRQWRLRVLSLVLFLASLATTSIAGRKGVVGVVLVCVFIAALNNWLDLLSPLSFASQGLEHISPGRGAGLYINPNQAGMAIVIMVIAVLPFVGRRYRGLLLATMLVGVFPTVSRSSIAFAVLLFAAVVLTGMVSRRQALLVAMLALMAVGIGWQAFMLDAGSGSVDVEAIRHRLAFLYGLEEATDASALERQIVAEVAWRIFQDAPVLGAGLASTTAAYFDRGTHNMYLLLLAEQGALGGILYFALIAIAFGKGYRLKARGDSLLRREMGTAWLLVGGYLAFFGLFSHNIPEDPRFLFSLAFLCTALRRRDTRAAWPVREGVSLAR